MMIQASTHAGRVPHDTFMTLVALALLFALTGCGGGGSSGTSTGAGTSPQSTTVPPSASGTPTATAPAPDSTPIATVPQSTVANVHPIVVATTPTQTRNMLTTSVTVCAPGTANCVTIDNVQVDTGSQGLRVFASQLPPSLALSAVSAAASASATNNISAECSVFTALCHALFVTD